MNTLKILSLATVSLLLVSACDEAGTTADPSESEAAVSDLDILLEGAPDNDKLPDEAKSDQVFEAKYTELADFQSPVKSQGSRGVCSIFSTIALMEHLYIKEGTLADPDFSEQFLQWSTKFELKRFTHTGGSNAGANLDAIKRFGVVMEKDEPYQTFKWSKSHDEACDGTDDQPTRCYTNGDASEGALAAKRWHLPTKRYISSRPENIKAFMVQNKAGVVAGMQFFYQSWNHRASKLPVNSEYWSEGYVLYPNADDKTKSTEKRAGHSILIIGWDDDLEVQTVDGEGNKVVDDNGDPVMEKGFWLFKNSWGRGGFGIRNEAGEGYGWLSMRYVEEYATVNGAGVPSLDLKESCDDGVDNDFNGAADCDDAACASFGTCQAPVTEFESTDAVAIPDDDDGGVTQTFEVTADGFATSVTVGVAIDHTFPGDLEVSLITPSGKRAVLFDQEEGLSTDLTRSWSPASLVGEAAKGTWSLQVRDLAARDTGTLNRWSLKLDVSSDVPVEVCDDGIDNTGNGTIDCADPACSGASSCVTGHGPWQGVSEGETLIPDADPDGVESVITIVGAGHIAEVEVLVDIEHTYIGDLTLTLRHPDGTSKVLQRGEGGGADELKKVFKIDAFNGKAAAGEWVLHVADGYAQDSGKIRSWLLDIKGL